MQDLVSFSGAKEYTIYIKRCMLVYHSGIKGLEGLESHINKLLTGWMSI
jgi:hypothetical protein